MIEYALTMIWNERLRFLPAVLAVAFSALLVALQFGVLIGTLSFISTPIDTGSADLWVASRDVPSIDLGLPIPMGWLARVGAMPQVERVEPLVFGFAAWDKPGGGTMIVCVIGSRLEADALGAVRGLTPELRLRLTEPGAIVIDESERGRLGIARGDGRGVEVSDRRIRIVGTLEGYKSIGGPYLFCSQRTARMLLYLLLGRPDTTTYLLVRCRTPEAAIRVRDELRRRYPSMSAFTRAEFSLRSRLYWLTQSKAGVALGLTAALALLVGLVITSQTLYAATVASLREFAVLRALGIPRRRIAALVLMQSLWIGVAGELIALPAIVGLSAAAGQVGARIALPGWLLAAVGAVTLALALASGLNALRSLRLVEPIALLR